MNRKTNESIGQGRGYSGLARVLAVLALLLTAATGAWAEETPKVVFEEHFVSMPSNPIAVGFYQFINFEEGDDHEVNTEDGELVIINSDGTLDIDNWNRRAITFLNLPLVEGKTYRLEFKLKGSTRFEDGINDGDDRPFCKASAQLLQGTERHNISLLDSDGKEQRGEFTDFDESNYKSYSMTFVFASEQRQKETYALNNQGELAEMFYLSLSIFNPGLFYLKDVVLYEIPSAAPVAVTGVTLPSTSSVTLGDAVALTATVAPEDATDKKVKWSVTSGSDKVKLYKDAKCKTEVGTEATDVLTVYAKGLAVGEATVKVESNADATKSATCTVTAKHGTYAVAMKDGVTDGDKWTAKAGGSGDFAAMPLKGVEGGTKPVELKYGGDLEVKRVTMRVLPAWKGDLSKLSATELESDGVTVLVKNGMTLTGTLSENYKITIADGATVTLDGVTINGTDDENYKWAGISCAGSATIVLKDGTENTVKGFHSDYPGIHVPSGATLTIQGPGKLTASSNGNAAGIGGGKNLACGNIVIAATVGKVKAMKGSDAPYSIGAGDESTCGTVTIGGTVYYDGSDYQNDGATYLAQDEIEYPTPVAFAANEYNAAWWDGSKVVFIKKTADSTPTAVANSNTAVTWSDGWYTVAGEVTISGNVTLGADTYLILQDGATLTINGQLNCRDNQKDLYIYGQKKGDGKLNVICSSSTAIRGKINKTVEIHGGEITAEGMLEGLSVGYIKVFSGKITATCSSNGENGIVFMNSCDVYGGEIEATTNNELSPSRGISDGANGGTFTVYGGKVKGTGSGIQIDPDNGSGFEGKVKSGTAGIKFYFSDNGTDWDEGTYYGTATAAPLKRYAKAE